MGIKLTKEQARNLFRDDNIYSDNYYVSNSNVINMKAADLYNDFMLISVPCGMGKSSYALRTDDKGLLADLNRVLDDRRIFDSSIPVLRPCDIWVLTSRTIIKEQLLQDNASRTDKIYRNEDLNFYQAIGETQEDKVKVGTYHEIGRRLRQGEKVELPKVMVCDEVHSLAGETAFAVDLCYVLKVLEKNTDVIKIGLTATPELLTNYIQKEDKLKDNFNFNVISKKVFPKYYVNNVEVVNNVSLENVLKGITTDETHKAFIFTNSAKRGYALACKDNCGKDKPIAKNICSVYCDSVDEDTGKTLADLMDNEVVKHLRQNKTFPQGIERIYATSAYQEGLDLKDEKLKYIIIDNVSAQTILQVLGRFRQNLDRLIIINNQQHKAGLESKIRDTIKFIDNYNAASDYEKGKLFAQRLQEQKQNKNVPKIAYEYNGEDLINYYPLAYWRYELDCYEFAANKEYVTLTIGGKEYKHTKEYFNDLLDRFIENPILFTDTPREKNNNAEKIRNFNFTDWLNKPLAKEDKVNLCAALDIKNESRRVCGWNTTKKLLLAAGYTVTDKRIGEEKKRVSIISA